MLDECYHSLDDMSSLVIDTPGIDETSNSTAALKAKEILPQPQ